MKIRRFSLVTGLCLVCCLLLAEERPIPASTLVMANPEPFTDPTRAITITADNPEFSIRLKSNPTTGYRWYLKALPSTWLEVLGEDYVPSNTTAVGAGGEETWHFKVLPEGFKARMLLSIEFVSVQAWNMKGPSTTQSFYVVTESKE